MPVDNLAFVGYDVVVVYYYYYRSCILTFGTVSIPICRVTRCLSRTQL